MAINVLSARKVETASPQARPYYLKDGGSLFLCVQSSGSKLWHYRYRIGGRPQIYSIGKYPTVTLEHARNERNRARELVKNGIHPLQERKANLAHQLDRNENTLKAVAQRWMATNSEWSDYYAKQVETYLGKDIFPSIGKLPISSIKASHLRPLIQAISDRGAKSVAVLVRQLCGQIFCWAATQGLCDYDPTSLLKGLVKRPRVRHNPPLSWAEIPEFFAKLDGWAGYRTTVIALRLMALTFVRTVELRKATWDQFDLEAALWTIPAKHMKMRRAHIVPLSKQTVSILKELQLLTGGGKILFPNYRKPKEIMSATTLNRALERLGYGGRFSAHGFRSTATTLLGLLGYPENRVDLQLAHAKKSSSRAPYDHTKYISSRRFIMQDWADVLDALAGGTSPAQVTADFGPMSERRSMLLRVIERE